VLVHQFLERSAMQSAQSAEFIEQALSHLDGVFSCHTNAQEDGDQF
jgi:hypothetical protein